MAYAVARSFEGDAGELLGVPRERTTGERLHLDVAKLLIAKKTLRITDLAIAMRQTAEWGSSLAATIIALGFVRPIDYYKAVAEVYGLPFVDLQREPIDQTLTRVEDRADYAERNIVPWRRIDGRLILAATEITTEHFLWGDERFGPDSYDFVITSPFDILWQTQQLFRDWDSFFAREALYSGSPSTRPNTR